MAWETTGERRKLCICDTAVRGRAKHGCGRDGKQAGPSTSRATPRHHMSCLEKRRKAVRSFAARCTRKTQRKRCESTVGHAHGRQPWSEVWGTWCGWCAGGNEVRNELAGSDGVRPTERGEAGAGTRVDNDRPLRRDRPETEAGLALHDAGDQGQVIACTLIRTTGGAHGAANRPARKEEREDTAAGEKDEAAEGVRASKAET
ncbi:hypothetical protein ERJ75_001145200 [Trypanosoma vivax]|nr:hypothetical protein ERJ75_001145200 [Trypanosoma vivax]